MKILVPICVALFFNSGCDGKGDNPHHSEQMELFGIEFYLKFDNNEFATNYSYRVDAYGDTTAEYSITDTTGQLKPQIVIKAIGGHNRCDTLAICESAEFYEGFMEENYGKYIRGEIAIKKSHIDNIEVIIVKSEINEVALFCYYGKMYIIDAFRFNRDISNLVSVRQLPR